MNKKKLKQELRALDSKQLEEKVDQLRRELFTLRLNSSTAHVKDYSNFKKLRANIARVLTCLEEKHNEQQLA